MLLTFDIGNTNIKVVVFDKQTAIHQWRISTNPKRTGDEYFSIIKSLMSSENVDTKTLENTIISSVVPKLIGAFVIATQKLTGQKPIILNPEHYKKLPVIVPENSVSEIGTDLLCDAVGAWNKYNQPCIIADFGTALSFTAIAPNAEIAGIAIAPGIGTAVNSLFNNAAQLPEVPLEIPNTSLGTNTVECIQSGIIFGYKGLVEGMISQMKNDMLKKYSIMPQDIRTIATGGFNSMLQPITNVFEDLDKQLTTNGLRLVAEIILKSN